MNDTDTETISRTDWHTMSFEGTTSLFRQFKTHNLQNAESVAGRALRLITNAARDKSSTVSYNSESCTISLHVAVSDQITQDYYDLADKIDKAVNHV